MKNITIFSHQMIALDSKDYSIKDREEMIVFLTALLDAVVYGDGTVILEKATVVDEGYTSPQVKFKSLGKWNSGERIQDLERQLSQHGQRGIDWD